MASAVAALPVSALGYLFSGADAVAGRNQTAVIVFFAFVACRAVFVVMTESRSRSARLSGG